MKERSEELQQAYNDLERAEKTISRLKTAADERYKVEQILIAAGFLTREKINETEALLVTLGI